MSFAALILVVSALTLSSAQDYSRFSALQQNAEKGDANSQYLLGLYYEDPQLYVRRYPDASTKSSDYAAALKWLTESSVQGNVDALDALGQMYENGEGVPENDSMAAVLYRAACERRNSPGGSPSGCLHLSDLYCDGRGVPQDIVEAYKYAFVADVIPATEVKELATRMTPSQMAEAQGRIQEWRLLHPSAYADSDSRAP